MNRSDLDTLIDRVCEEISRPGGVFQSRFGSKTPEELAAYKEVIGLALMAADHYYSHLTELNFTLREESPT